MPILNTETPANSAAKNIAAVIDAMTDAQKSQLDLKKAVMMKQIGDKEDLAMNAAKLHQSNVSGMEGQQMQMDWLKGLAGNGQQTQANGTNAAGVATNAMPAAQGAPAVQGQPQANPMAPTPTPQQTLTAPTQPNAGAGGQPIVTPGRTQAPMNPVLNSPSAAPGGAPIMPTSIQYNNLGYKPVEAQQVVATRRQQNQPINLADKAYVQALQKVKAGTATQGEIDMVHKMNNKDESGQPTTNPLITNGNKPQESQIQQGLRAYEKATGWPPGSAMFDPSKKPGDGAPVMINPVWKSQQEGANQYNLTAPDRYGQRAESDLMKIFSNRSGDLGVQNGKIGQAMHIRQLFDQAYDPKTNTYNINSSNFHEATQGLANLVSGSTQQSDKRIEGLTQRTLTGDFNGALTYWTGKPQNATTQDLAKMYVNSVDRQADTAQTLKDSYLSGIKRMDSFNQLKRLDPERAQNLYDASFGINYKDFINKPWNERVKMITGQDPNDAGGQAAAAQTYGGLTIDAAKAKGYTAYNPQTQQWR